MLKPLGWGIPLLIILYGPITTEIYPAEDATILYRYSENLAETGVISFNPGGERAEGATDFLWMVLLAGFYKLGIPCYVSARILSSLALIGSYFILGNLYTIQYPASRIPHQFAYIPAFLLAALFLNSQGMAAIQGFSMMVFGFLVLLCVLFYVKDQFRGLVVSVLFLTLFRPDGMVMGGPLILSAMWLQRQQIQKNIWTVMGIGIIPGMIYFMWRYQYFGLLFPLPFYVKTHAEKVLGIFVKGSVLYEVGYLAKYVFPLLIGGLMGWVSRQKEPQDQRSSSLISQTKTGLLIFSIVCCPFVFYATIVLEQNIADRFLYPAHLGILVSFVILLRNKRLFTWLGGLYLLLSFGYFLIYLKGTLEISTNNIYPIAQDLAHIKGHKMAVTEAGRLPYYSGWESMDLWGLNTPDLAKKPVQKVNLEAFGPDLIVLDVGYTPKAFLSQLPTEYKQEKSWEYVMQNSYLFATESGTFEAFLVPFQKAEYLTQWAKSFVALIQHIINWKGSLTGTQYPPPYTLQHIYLLNKESAQYPNIKRILEKHGALNPPTHSSPTPYYKP